MQTSLSEPKANIDIRYIYVSLKEQSKKCLSSAEQLDHIQWDIIIKVRGYISYPRKASRQQKKWIAYSEVWSSKLKDTSAIQGKRESIKSHVDWVKPKVWSLFSTEEARKY